MMVKWAILDLSQSRGHMFWLTAYLRPVRPTLGPSSLLLNILVLSIGMFLTAARQGANVPLTVIYARS